MTRYVSPASASKMSWTQRMAWSFTCLFALIAVGFGQAPPRPENTNAGTSFLDHNTPISSYYGQTFLKDNIPFIDIPDSNIQEVYYYRANSLSKHLRYTTAGTGYILTEFINAVGYAQAFNTIDAAAGHQIDETSILRGKFYNNDYINVYLRGPGNSVQYTQWILDAMYRRSQMDGETFYTNFRLSDMIRLWDEWDPYFDQNANLYHFTPEFDAQENSLPGFITGNQYHGPQTYRPSLNAYMLANARAVASVAGQAGNTAVASNFTTIADKLKQAMYDHLWDPVQQFFVDVIAENNPNLSPVSGREEVGFYPFRFGVGLNSTYGPPSVQQLFDPQGFFATYGPTTLEIRNKYFDPGKLSNYCCYWNGQSWPFSTAHTLTSLASLYRSGNSNATVDQYNQLLGIYATTQHKNGVPYIAESHHPFNNSWSADSRNHSEHYDHSTYCFNVITGLLGVIPHSDETFEISPIIPSNWTYFAVENLAYHNHLITVLYDSTGSKYGQGSGLTIYIDGNKTYNGHDTNAKISLSAPPSSTYIVPVNIAANPIGPGQYPLANATYTWQTDWEYKAIDGYLFYDDIPDNRWTNYKSPNAQDTLQVTFARPNNVSSVTLALYQDTHRSPSGSVDIPASIEIHGTSGLLASSQGPFLANDRNTISFTEVETEFIAVTMSNKAPNFVGVCELEVWVPPNNGPTYYAADAQLKSASVTTDSVSTATRNGAVVSSLSSDSEVAFSGIDTLTGTPQTRKLSVTYFNAGSATVTLAIKINQVNVTTVSLPPTSGHYAATDTVSISLPAGQNFLSLSGGSADIRLETIVLSDDSGGNGNGSGSASATQTAAPTGKPNAASPPTGSGRRIPSWWVGLWMLICGRWLRGYL